MKKISHRVITGSLMLAMQSRPEAVIGAVVGSMMPDIDIKLGIAHRTWTHWWPMYAVPMFVITSMDHENAFQTYMGQEISTLLFWMCVGALLHLLEDSLTVMGIPMITPVPAPEANGVPWLTRKRRFSLGITHTGGILEYLIMVIVLVVAVVVIKQNPAYQNELMAWPKMFIQSLKI